MKTRNKKTKNTNKQTNKRKEEKKRTKEKENTQTNKGGNAARIYCEAINTFSSPVQWRLSGEVELVFRCGFSCVVWMQCQSKTTCLVVQDMA